MALTIGDVIEGRYRVARLLGQGGMGAVYRAWDMRLDRPVALKEMTPQSGLDAALLAELRDQFRQEAQILATLVHPNLVRVTDYFSWGGNEYLVMDFVEGESLAERIQREGAQSEQQVLAWADQLLGALSYCHGRGIIHRDIKPQNIIITPQGRAVLVDFGLVKLWDPRDPHTRTVMRGAGTPEYAPPEQYDMGLGHTDPRSDVYGLGATLYHALTGQTPPTATQRMASPATFMPPRQINAEVSPATEAALLKALEMVMERRFRNAEEMAQALKGAPQAAFVAPVDAAPDARRAPPTVAIESAAAPPAAGQPRKRGTLLGLGTAGLILGGLLCLILVGGAVLVGLYMVGGEDGGGTTQLPPTTHPTITAQPPTEQPTDTPGPQTFYIAADGSGDYGSLEEAVETVPAGSTLTLGPGTYQLADPLYIDKPLRLVGAGEDQTEIVSQAKSYVVRFSGNGLFAAEDISFRHQGTATADVVLIEGGEIDLQRCRFIGAYREEEEDARTAGLHIMGDTIGSVKDCVAVENNRDGIRLDDQARPTLTGNTCTGNEQAGIRFSSSAAGTAAQNECIGNTLSGIIVTDAAQPTLEGNTCSDNEQSGIVFFDQSGGEARNNTSSGNGLHGIGITDQARPTLTGNTCTGNEQAGIRFSSSAAGTAAQNECTGNTLSGIIVTDAAQPTLEDNICTQNVESGIAYFEDAGGTARGNMCTGNELHGIGLSGQAQPTLTGNTCSDNEQVGIRFSDSSGGRALQNECARNGLSGIIVREGANPTVESNTCTDNEENGIAYFGETGGAARQNTCSENGLHGISVNDQAQPTLEDNVCNDNLEAGIAYFENAAGAARRNECARNQWGIFVKETANPELADNALYDNTTSNLLDRR